jgi:deoxyribodipyrimidine photo-lyase
MLQASLRVGGKALRQPLIHYSIAMIPPTLSPTSQAASERIAAVNPSIYAKTRNFLNGDVTYLSPYITHGFIDIPTIAAALYDQRPLTNPLTFNDKIIFEFAWREFFHHAWAIKGDRIFKGVHESVYAGKYAPTLPDDIAQGRTGVPAIDAAVRQLYATGYLHNHARMWLASYVVHLRKVHWRVGADWLYAHLLDGDCGSNYLSWQWVAGTFSSKPYLFNAENVATYAKTAEHAHWHSAGTVIDQSYEAIDAWARSSQQAQAEPGHHAGVLVPTVSSVPERGTTTLNLAEQLRGKHVRLVHPWDLIEVPDNVGSVGNVGNVGDVGDVGDDAIVDVAWLCPAFHVALPWSHTRWDWVLARMVHITPFMVVGDAAELAPLLAGAQTVQVQLTKNAAYLASIQALIPALPQLNTTLEPALLPPVDKLCNSFTKYYQTAQKLAGRLENCL